MQLDLTEAPPDVAERASDLHNLLQIIRGTTDLLENIWAGRDDSGKYLAMLRTSVDRAAQLTIELVETGGGATGNYVAALLPKESAAAARRKPRVMVVDDEPMMRAVFEELLETENYDVITADSGCEALDVLGRDPCVCDVIVLDLTMPFMRGDEVFRRMRAICPTLPVILATGFIHRRALDTMLEAGLTAFISKPVAPEELIAVMAQVLGEQNKPLAVHGTAAAR